MAQHGLEAKTKIGPDDKGQAIKNFHDANHEQLAKAGHMGGWHDPSDNMTYLDATKLHPDTPHGMAHAIADGYKNRQLAVFNLDRGHSLTMRPGESSDLRDARDAGQVSPATAHAQAQASPSAKPQRAANRQAIKAVQPKKPKGVSDISTSQLAAGFRNRRPV